MAKYAHYSDEMPRQLDVVAGITLLRSMLDRLIANKETEETLLPHILCFALNAAERTAETEAMSVWKEVALQRLERGPWTENEIADLAGVAHYITYVHKNWYRLRSEIALDFTKRLETDLNMRTPKAQKHLRELADAVRGVSIEEVIPSEYHVNLFDKEADRVDRRMHAEMEDFKLALSNWISRTGQDESAEPPMEERVIGAVGDKDF